VLINKVTLFFATAANVALAVLCKGKVLPAFFRLALTTVAVKSQSPYLSSGPLAAFSEWRLVLARIYISGSNASKSPFRILSEDYLSRLAAVPDYDDW